MESDLTTRQRELIVFRIAWRYNSAHQWTHHILSGRKIGKVDAEFDALCSQVPSSVWSDEEQAIIDAVDRLCHGGQIDDQTWAGLALTMDTQKLIDLLYAVSLFTMNAWAFNAMGIELEPDMADYSKPAEELLRAQKQ